MRPVHPLALVLVAIAPSCGGGGGGGKCRGELAEVGRGCPPSFDGDATKLYCDGFVGTIRSRACGDLIGLGTGGSIASAGCYYDPSTHELVGVYGGGSDVATFCDGTSFTIAAGRTSDCGPSPISSKDCPVPVDASVPPPP